MIPSLLKNKLAVKYGQDFVLPAHINLLKPFKEAYQGDEHELQKSFFKWLSMFYVNTPELWLFHAIPNGGNRSIVEAGRFKAEGVKAGIPDTFLPIPKKVFAKDGVSSKFYSGFYMEFKTKRNKPDEDQRIMMLMLDNLGYKVVCINTLEDAIAEYSYYFA